jgi:cell division protein FtsB
MALLVYFGWHAVDGRYGLLAWRDYRLQLEASQAELAALEAERLVLERRVAGLKGAIDPDLLDEYARRSLSLVGPLDVIILLDEDDRSELARPGPDGG